MAQMKTIFVEEFGEPEVLRYTDAERPSPGEGEVLIEVRSAGVNYADTMRRRNQYVVSQDLPFVPSLREVLGWISSSDLQLTIGATYPLEKAAEAHADLESRRPRASSCSTPDG